MSAGAISLLLIPLALSACREVSPAPPQGAVLRIGFGVGDTARSASLPALTDILYAESLLTREWDGRQTSRLATEWWWEEGGKTLRLRLKEGVRLHDGTLLTPALVAESLNGVLERARRNAVLGFEYITGITAPDERHVVIRLSQPDFFLPTALSDRTIVHPERPDIGTGPFRLVSRVPVIEASRFDDYHGGRSSLAGVRIETYDTSRSVWAALMRGDIDAAQEVNRASVEFLERSSQVQLYPSLQSFYVPLVFNQRHPALGHVAVRRALAGALDRRAIVERAMHGRGEVAVVPVWPRHWAYRRPQTTYEYDPEGSRELLDRAGFPLPARTRPGELRKRFSFRCLVYNEDPQYERIALMVKRQLFDIGVDMSIELVGMRAFQDRAAAGDFDSFLMRANAGRSLDVTYRFWHSAAPGRTPLQNSGYAGTDAALDRLRSSTSDDETRGAVAELVERFQQDAPAVFIAWLEVTRAVSTAFSVGDIGTQDPFTSIRQWRPAPPSADTP